MFGHNFHKKVGDFSDIGKNYISYGGLHPYSLKRE